MKSFNSFLKDNQHLFLFALLGVIVHFALNGQYGFHRDELDILMNARQLDWGYVAYPPITPLIARIGLAMFGGSLRGLRLFPAVAQGLVMVLAGWIARDMGGKRSAQLMAAVVVYSAPIALVSGTLIQYMSFDYLCWVMVAFFTVRLIATDDLRYWLGIGASIGLGMMTKYTIAFWVAGLIIAVLISSLRRHLLSKWLWLGVGLALLIYLPNLVWQIQHDFISVDFLKFIHARDIQWGRTDNFFIEQLLITSNPLTLPLWIAGLAACLFYAPLKRFQPLVWMFAASIALLVLNRGRGYYTAPAYAVPLAAGCVWLEKWLETHTEKVQLVGQRITWAWVSVSALVGIVLIKPIAPINSALWEITTKINEDLVEMIGWEELTAQVGKVYQSIPEAEKPRTVILAGNYGEAGALDLYGTQYDLPRIISGSNSLWARGYGDFEPKTTIILGYERREVLGAFEHCKNPAMITNRYNIHNEESDHHSAIYVCREPKEPWSDMWQKMQVFQ